LAGEARDSQASGDGVAVGASRTPTTSPRLTAVSAVARPHSAASRSPSRPAAAVA